jgi:SAM-dependent methyltransferase
LDRLYEAEYYQTHNAGWFEKERREQWYWWLVYYRRLQYAQELLKRSRPSEVLDVGAGAGWFCKTAADFGWGYQGVEPSEYAREWALSELSIELHPLPQECMGVHFIHAALLLEHLLGPDAALDKFYTSLCFGGVLCIIVPNEFNPLQNKLAQLPSVTVTHPSTPITSTTSPPPRCGRWWSGPGSRSCA